MNSIKWNLKAVNHVLSIAFTCEILPTLVFVLLGEIQPTLLFPIHISIAVIMWNTTLSPFHETFSLPLALSPALTPRIPLISRLHCHLLASLLLISIQHIRSVWIIISPFSELFPILFIRNNLQHLYCTSIRYSHTYIRPSSFPLHASVHLPNSEHCISASVSLHYPVPILSRSSF